MPARGWSIDSHGRTPEPAHACPASPSPRGPCRRNPEQPLSNRGSIHCLSRPAGPRRRAFAIAPFDAGSADDTCLDAGSISCSRQVVFEADRSRSETRANQIPSRGCRSPPEECVGIAPDPAAPARVRSKTRGIIPAPAGSRRLASMPQPPTTPVCRTEPCTPPLRRIRRRHPARPRRRTPPARTSAHRWNPRDRRPRE